MRTVTLLVALLTFPFAAHAYITPELGSLLYQQIIGVVLVLGTTWRFVGTHVVGAFRNLFKRKRP